MGYAYVAYLPNGKLIGLSKIARIVKFFAKRPQLQERLTAQIADSLGSILETEDVAVSITAQHFCVVARGIEDQNGHTTTNVFHGKFEEPGPLRQEFFEAMRQSTES
jgi:GTP cyclohydrolase IA